MAASDRPTPRSIQPARSLAARLLVGAWLSGLSSGCGFLHRIARIPAPIYPVTKATDEAPLGVIAIQDEAGAVALPEPQPHKVEGWVLPALVNRRDHLVVWPAHEGVELRVFTASGGMEPSNFTEIRAVQGARDREFVDQLRLLPGPSALDEPTSVAIPDLANVRNGRPLGHDDLVLVELSDGDTVQHALFQNRRVGPYLRGGIEVVVRTPLEPTVTSSALSPAATLGLQLGYRSANRSGELAKALDRITLVGSLGVGTTALDQAVSQGELDQTVSGVLVAGIGGGGVKLGDTVSVQVLGNLGALAGEVPPEWALAVGLDTGRIAFWTRHIGARLFRKNTLAEPPALPPAPPPDLAPAAPGGPR